MIEIKNDKLAVPVVLFAGILWSFGPLVVRYMDQPELVPWQYIFGRGLTIFIILNLYLLSKLVHQILTHSLFLKDRIKKLFLSYPASINV